MVYYFNCRRQNGVYAKMGENTLLKVCMTPVRHMSRIPSRLRKGYLRYKTCFHGSIANKVDGLARAEIYSPISSFSTRLCLNSTHSVSACSLCSSWTRPVSYVVVRSTDIRCPPCLSVHWFMSSASLVFSSRGESPFAPTSSATYGTSMQRTPIWRVIISEIRWMLYLCINFCD